MKNIKWWNRQRKKEPQSVFIEDEFTKLKKNFALFGRRTDQTQKCANGIIPGLGGEASRSE